MEDLEILLAQTDSNDNLRLSMLKSAKPIAIDPSNFDASSLYILETACHVALRI